MGLLITTYLIASNVYGSVDAPPSRGFSNVELWITGVQCNILLAIFEYLFVLCTLRFSKNVATCYDITKFVQTIDTFFFVFSLTFLITFNSYYWTSIKI